MMMIEDKHKISNFICFVVFQFDLCTMACEQALVNAAAYQRNGEPYRIHHWEALALSYNGHCARSSRTNGTHRWLCQDRERHARFPQRSFTRCRKVNVKTGKSSAIGEDAVWVKNCFIRVGGNF